MTLEEALSFIHCTDWKGSRLGLERMRELLKRLGDPQETLKFIHVAGTNGKGSTCAMLASILREAGYRTGLYTSPHLFRVNERMNINGMEISDEALIDAAATVRDAVAGMADQPTEFEIITAMALYYFCRERCDLVVLEVGLGGRLDATNVILPPEVAVLTNIGLEHTEILGDTLEKIAKEKAGIVKPGCLVAAYPGTPEVERVYREVCRGNRAELHVVRFDEIRLQSADFAGQTFAWNDLTELYLPLLGEHQLHNAAVALTAVERLRKRGWRICDDALRAGLAGTVWPARFEVLSRDPLFIADGAHNPQCVEMLERNLCLYFSKRSVVFLIGVLADKDYERMLSLLIPHAGAFICLTPDSPRALPATELAAYLRQRGARAEACATAADGIRMALETAEGAPVVACGSLYMMGEIRHEFHRALKNWERRQGIRARKALPSAQRQNADTTIVRKILESEAYRAAKTVMSYVAVRGEVDLHALQADVEAQGKRLVYPFCTSNTEMEALLPAGASAWRKGMYDIPEPVPEQSEVIDPREIDLVLCPCTAFDAECHRMGMGAGYYDRFLPRCARAAVVAVAYETQKQPSLSAGVWDYPMDAVITQQNVYRPSHKE